TGRIRPFRLGSRRIDPRSERQQPTDSFMPHASKLHRLAKRIADKLSQGKPPALTAEMAAYLEDRPEAVFDSLDGFVRQHGESDEGNPLAAAYLMLMAIQLEHLRYQIDRDYAWAKEMQREFERRVVSLAQAGDL